MQWPVCQTSLTKRQTGNFWINYRGCANSVPMFIKAKRIELRASMAETSGHG